MSIKSTLLLCSVVAFAALAPAAASAQTSFSISIGSGYGGGNSSYGYPAYGYSNPYGGSYLPYGYSSPYEYDPYNGYNAYSAYNGYNAYNSYNSRAYEWAQRRRAEQLERWRRERARQDYRGSDEWDDDDD